MPKIIESLEFDSELFKKYINSSSFVSLTSFASELGFTKQAFHFWLEQGKMPASKMHQAIKLLKLDSECINKVIHYRVKKKYQVLFRTRRNVPIMISNKARASLIGQNFFDWHEPTKTVKNKIKTIVNFKDHIDFAHQMQKQLGISDCSSITTASLVKILEKFDIHVLFVDFDEIFDFKDLKKNVPCAFCIKEDDSQKYAIVVNLREYHENMLWIIIHELTHIFAGHLDRHSNDVVEDKEQEVFSNNVSNEFMTPKSWFQDRKSNLITQFSGNKSISVYYTEEIARKLNSSFMGVILALSEHQIISTHTKSYLMAVHHHKEKRGDRHKIHQVIGADYEKRFSFWKDAFKNIDALNYLKLQNIIRRKMFDESISNDRISELLGITEIEVESLRESWKNELSSDL